MKNDPVQITRNSTKSIEPFETADSIELSAEEAQMLNAVADLLEYPTLSWFDSYELCKDLILTSDDSAADHFSNFCLEIRPLSLLELQELYTRTFDLSPVCALEIGYHLFGEDYKRGEFLARLREDQNEYQLGQERQLPDFLPVLLRLLRQFEDSEERAALIGYCLIPGLSRMIDAFDKKENPYGNLIRFLSDFLKEIGRNSLQTAEPKLEARYEYA